ncbi:MAG: serine--tRNA ligase [Chitinophagales bacterium]
MLPIQLVEQDKKKIINGLKKRGFDKLSLVEDVIQLNQDRKEHKRALDLCLSEANTLSKKIGQLFASGDKAAAEASKSKSLALKETAKELQDKLHKAEADLQFRLEQIPNIPHEKVPAGTCPDDNKVISGPDSLPKLSDDALAHWDLMDKYELGSLALGNKITGAGFPVFSGKGARLQRALTQYFLDTACADGYTEIIPPYLVNEETAYGTGQLPDKEGQMYEMKLEKYYLVPTAEVPVTNIYRDHIFKESELPQKLAAHSHCFRREAGSYGKDVRGLNRVHQFEKVEIVQFVHPEKSYDVLEEMVAYVESLLKALELPYRKLLLCGGDMGFTSAMTYDLEVYSAAQKRWLEVSSISNFETFQSNRMKIKYKDSDNKNQLIHTLNGSALALPRIYAALLENNQSTEGIKIPKVLQPYAGFELIE